MKKDPRKTIGRPSVDSEAVNVRLGREVLTALDNWRREQPDLPGRPEAMRRIVVQAVMSPKAKGKRA